MRAAAEDASARPWIDGLVDAVNQHDLEALVRCFAPGYVNETPAHPSRGFTGRDQVRANWSEIFAGVPDVRTAVSRSSVDGDVVWSELEMAGTRRDGEALLMRGVVIFTVVAGLAVRGRFYLEPVLAEDGDVGGAVRAAVGGPG